MLFSFLKYIAPTWYYNISSEDSRANHYFLDYRTLDLSQQSLLDIDNGYHTVEAILCDAAYQIMKKGIMNKEAKPMDIEPQKKHSRRIKWFGDREMDINSDIYITDVADNYRFVKRYFHKSHLYRILVHRLITFHNPFKEINGFVKAQKVNRLNVYDLNGFAQYKKEYVEFDSELIKSNPKVSVVIPTLNRYEYLKDVMSDLEQQDYKNFEVIVVDQTDPFNEDFYKGWNLDLKVSWQEEKALWLARNNAIKSAVGEYILLYDDDSRVDPDWISQHLKCLDYYKCNISSGVSLSVVGAKVPEDYAYFKWSDQIDTGNVMFAKNMMRDTGMFDRQFEKQRMGDGEYGLRSYLCGKTNISNPYAKRIHLKVAQGGLRQMGSWDALRPKKLFAPRPVPSTVYLNRKYFGNRIARMVIATNVPTSLLPYKYKSKHWASVASMFLAVLGSPVVFMQTCISWKQAGEKLKEGDKIERL